MSYRKAALLALGGGLLLAIAVATIDGIVVARLMSGAYVCPDRDVLQRRYSAAVRSARRS